MATPWGSGTGGGPEAQRWYANRDFQEIFGRAPTEAELSMFQAAYDSGDRNIANTSAGRSAIAQYYQSQENTPDRQYARQQAQYQAAAPQHYGAVDQLFQSTLGRAATDAERNHFGSLLASGQVDQYTLGQFVGSLPEAVQRQDKSFREGLSGELQKQDAQYYNEQIMPGIQSAFANQGRDVRSSGFSNSLALAAQAQNRQREAFLSNLTAQQYGGRQNAAREDYLNSYGQMRGLQDYSRQRSDQLADRTQGRVNELQDYAMQRRVYDDYLRRYGRRGTQGIGGLIGGLVGAGAGLYASGGNPQGGYLGSYLGSNVGGYSEGLI